MSSDEDLKTFAELKTYIENEIDLLEKKLEKLKRFLKVLNTHIGKISFKTAESLRKSKNLHEYRTITDSQGKIIASIKFIGDTLIITPKEKIKATSPSVTSFFVKRVLAKMKNDDLAAFKEGKLTEEKLFEYELSTKEGFLQEIRIWNARNRVSEIEKTLRWTLEKARK